MRQRQYRLCNTHWSRSGTGTGICSFRVEDLPYYRAALKRANDKQLVLHPVALQGAKLGQAISLHDLWRRKDLSRFWAIFELEKARIEGRSTSR